VNVADFDISRPIPEHPDLVFFFVVDILWN